MTRLRTLYALAIFLASCLLFLAEPMAGKRLAPLFGGSAAVWITCLVFFQTALLLGYCCAHWLATRVGPRRQGRFYLIFVAAGLLFMLNPDRKIQANLSHPILSVFWLLIVLIGVPFLTLSAASPLLQAWHARDVAAKTTPTLRPGYRLFALSNFGSLAALAAYPTLIEPHFTLHAQGIAWSIGYLLYALVCASLAFLSRPAVETSFDRQATLAGGRLATVQIVLWLSLAACGSLLLCAVTAYMSQNIAPIPLLWILPLIVYLLSFIVTFQGDKFYPRVPMLILLVVALGALGYACALDRTDLNLETALPLFYLALLICCLFCHGELYRRRPAAAQMTSFYVCVAAGGAIGAFLVGVVAPLAFNANYELPCTLVVTAVLALVVTWRAHFAWRIVWSAGAVAMMVVFGMYVHTIGKLSIAKMRNFYGTLTVYETQWAGGPARMLQNGPIAHGMQFQTPNLRYMPTTYFTEDSGVGLALNLCCEQRARRVGIVGLGAGTLAAYGRPGDVFRFYELNPLVEKIAHEYFTFLADSKAHIDIVTGDARVSLQNEEPQRFDVLVLDAFSGDAIPVHLLTRQAFALYQRHLQPNGILAFHVSNKYLNLAPVVAQLADQAGLPPILITTQENGSLGEYASDWILATANTDFLGVQDEYATPITRVQGLRLWTDDYNSLLPVLFFK